MSSSSRSLSFEECFDAELNQIVRRRRQVGLLPSETELSDESAARQLVAASGKAGDHSDGLVGLALSGGGVRSAAFNLGVLQTLRAKGRLHEFDYLSTVSGGGYVGSYIASLALTEGIDDYWSPSPPATRQASSTGSAPHEPPAVASGASNGRASRKEPTRTLLDVDEFGRQPEGVHALIDRCRFLNRVVPWLNRQLIGMVMIATLLGSGLVCIAALTAWAYRLIDLPNYSRFPSALGFRTDVSRAFFYSFVLFVAWIVAWGAAYVTRGSRAVGAVARWIALLFVVSLCLGVAALAGTGDVQMAGWHADYGTSREQDESLTSFFSGYVGKSLIGALLLMLLPYLNPKAVIRSATKPRNAIQRWTYVFASRALLFGVPLLFFYLFARENLSLQQEKLAQPAMRLTEEERADGQTRPYAAHRLVPPDIASYGEFWRQVELDAMPPSDAQKSTNLSVPLVRAALARSLLECVRDRKDFKDSIRLDDATLKFFADHGPIGRWACAVGYGLAREDDNDFYKQCDNFDALLASKESLLHALNDRMEGQGNGTMPLLDVSKLPQAVDEWKPNDKEGQQIQATLLSLKQLQAQRDSAAQSKQDVSDEFNSRTGAGYRSLLYGLYPRLIAPMGTIHGYRVIHADQAARLWWAKWAGFVFLASLVLVNLNATSLHQWYRDALGRAWLGDDRFAPRDIPLDRLDTTGHGLPYPLLAATISVSWEQLGEKTERDLFVFSPRHCGSQRYGFTPTAELSGGTCDLATAMAVSGAAVGPVQINDMLTSAVMFVTNSRLGQWFVNPRRKDWMPQSLRESTWGKAFSSFVGKLWVSPGMVLLDWVLLRPFQGTNQRRYCFLSDGGQTENLGVEALLRRRCRVIVASDAGYDPEYRFDDFDRLQSRAEQLYGIRIRAIHSPADPVDVGPLVPFRAPPQALNGALADRSTEWKSGAAGEHIRNRTALSHVIVARILYPPQMDSPDRIGPEEGILFYIKPTFAGDEGQLLRYRDSGAFPFDPTYDQMFDSEKFLAYIDLGRHIGEALVERLGPPRPPGGGSGGLSRLAPGAIDLRASSPPLDLPNESAANLDEAKQLGDSCNVDNLSLAIRYLTSPKCEIRRLGAHWFTELATTVRDQLPRETFHALLGRLLWFHRTERDDEVRSQLEEAMRNMGVPDAMPAPVQAASTKGAKPTPFKSTSKRSP